MPACHPRRYRVRFATPARVEATLERVRGSITATGFLPNLAASNLASNRGMTAAAIIPTISVSVLWDAVHGLDQVLSPHSSQLFIASTDHRLDREDELIRAIFGRRPDGAFMVVTAHTETATQLLRDARIPVVETWNLTESPIHSMVGFSNREAIRAIVQYVVSKGYRHPTFADSLQAGDVRAIDRRRSFEAPFAICCPTSRFAWLTREPSGATWIRAGTFWIACSRAYGSRCTDVLQRWVRGGGASGVHQAWSRRSGSLGDHGLRRLRNRAPHRSEPDARCRTEPRDWYARWRSAAQEHVQPQYPA